MFESGDKVVLNMPGFRVHGQTATIEEKFSFDGTLENLGFRVSVDGTPHRWLVKSKEIQASENAG